jgi:hypothetical protein
MGDPVLRLLQPIECVLRLTVNDVDAADGLVGGQLNDPPVDRREGQRLDSLRSDKPAQLGRGVVGPVDVGVEPLAGSLALRVFPAWRADPAERRRES